MAKRKKQKPTIEPRQELDPTEFYNAQPGSKPKAAEAVEESSQDRHPTIEILELFPLQGEWTEEDYFNLPDTNRLIELSEGRPVILEMPTISHQRVLERLYKAIDAFSEKNAVGEVHIAPLPVRLWQGKIREPDIVFISNVHKDRIGEDFLGVPDLVVEVISMSTEQIDRTEKFIEYAQAGVSEYWIADPTECTIEVFVLERRAYVLLGKWGVGGIAHSKVLAGFEVAVEAVV